MCLNSFCDRSLTTPACVALVPEGAACSSYDQCVTGYCDTSTGTCRSWICKP
jgi:hypothetical protein